jgi:carbamoyltransferase
MTNEKFDKLFDGPPRKPESNITVREMDLAASIQLVTEEIVLKMARHLRKETGLQNLVMAGGVALNCVANGKIIKEGIFDNLWIQPAAGDAGGALGAALLTVHNYFDIPRKVSANGRDSQRGSYLGPRYEPHEIKAFLDRNGYPYEEKTDEGERAKIIAQALATGQIIGFMSGRMEFGPRALGARSILGDPRNKETQSVMNLKIKHRESFRPFAPSVLAEDCLEYFDLECESPYMLLVAPVKESRCIPIELREALMKNDGNMLSIVNQTRSDLPAITHVDYSARIQTVCAEDHPDYYRVIKAFKEITGYGVVVNTSFNVRGEPIVCTPEDCYRCFMRTEIDLLVLENCLLWKEKQPAFDEQENWKDQYELD